MSAEEKKDWAGEDEMRVERIGKADEVGAGIGRKGAKSSGEEKEKATTERRRKDGQR